MVLLPPGPVSTYPCGNLAAAGLSPVLEASAMTVVIVSYEGEKDAKGLCNGEGTATFIDGHSYTGQWENGYMHGQGKYTWVDGPTFEGSFVMNKISGEGTYTWPGSGKYEGKVQDGKRHGHGVLSFELDAAVYDGQWQHGLRHGHGKLTFNAEGTCFYEGGWVNDLKSGDGKMVYSNGNVYEGKWTKNQKNGQGKMVWNETGEMFTGEWLNGYPNGYGEHIWFGVSLVPSKSNKAQYLMYNRYAGQFVQGRREGEGTFYYSTGARYEGQWLDSKKHGEGIFIFEDGTVFVGSFENDTPLGVMPEKFGPQEPGPKVYVEDLLMEEPNSGDAYNAVLKMLLCHNSELRGIYDTYSSLQIPELEGLAGMTGTSMLSGQAWKFVLDCNIPSRQLSFADCCEALHRGCQAPPAMMARRRKYRNSKTASAYIVKDSNEPYSPTYTILFREFCEGIVRMAQLKYHIFPNLERRVHKLINDDILPKAKRPKKPLAKAPSRAPGMLSRAKSTKAVIKEMPVQPEAPPPKPTIAELVVSDTMRPHVREMDTVIAMLYSIALHGGVPAYLEQEKERELQERIANMPTHRHMSSFRGRKSVTSQAKVAFSREPKLSNSITIRGCLKVLHDCGLLEPRPDQPVPGSQAQGEDDQDGEAAAPEPAAEGQTDGTKEPGETDADMPQPPPPDPSYKITMESAYAALLETLLPVGSSMEPTPPTSRPASPPKLTPPGSAVMPPASPLVMSSPLGPTDDAASSLHTEQPVEIWMLEYTVMYTQFVEWLARCASRADPSDRFPLHIKLWQYMRKTYVDVLSPICSSTSALPKFLENQDVQNFIDAVKDREREAYEEAVRAHLATPQSNLESVTAGESEA